ncbi:hypothetical protein MTQ10_29165 [Streptomyces sp. XM83C]|uniref:hypothetical protein n=1 Tax=Streptomyces sp. XM83C TaxID=2929781 RepID=UPI001FFB413F|nr:hypothetical protein [Streptomyces sp. XM83C]MCK1823548.1 hypothetical protein [Streptomyces sp. XM83C]
MAENTAPGETGDGLTIIGPDDGIGWQPDPDGPQAHALVQGKREVAVDAVTPVPGRPGEYYVFIGDT